MSVQRVDTPDGISWHTETFMSSHGSAHEYIVLIPSGEGDCHSMEAVARLLSTNGPYHVLTFDMPGMSRTTAPLKAFQDVTPKMLADQVIGLLDKLQISRASFFGCSSGGITTLTISAMHPSRMKCAIVHEVPLERRGDFESLQSLSDEEVKDAITKVFVGMNATEDGEGQRKWQALGPDYHARLQKNFVTWIRNYVTHLVPVMLDIVADPENLKHRPLFWTVGALNPGVAEGEGRWKQNFVVARNAGREVDTKRLRCMHFPTVTVPEDTATWIAECVAKAG